MTGTVVDSKWWQGGKLLRKGPSWMLLREKKHDEAPCRVPFHWTKLPYDFLRIGAPPQTIIALFTVFVPAIKHPESAEGEEAS